MTYRQTQSYLPSRFERCLLKCEDKTNSLVELEIISRPNVALLNYKPRQHNPSHPVNVFLRVNQIASPMTLTEKSLNKATGNRAFDTVRSLYIQVCAPLELPGPYTLWEETGAGKSSGLSCRAVSCS